MKLPFFVRYGLLIAAIGVFLWPVIGARALFALKSNKNDVQDWLPADYEETKTFKWFLNHFAGEEFILASWEGCTLDDRARLELFVNKLLPAQRDSGRPEHWFFASSLTGPQVLDQLTSEPVALPQDEAIRRLKGVLVGPDGKTTCAVLTLAQKGNESLRKTVDRVRQVAQECNISLDKLHLGGPAVDNAAIDEAGEKSLLRLASLAGGIGIIISWWCLRSGRLMMMVFFTGMYSAALSLALVNLAGSNMNAILMTMPSLVYVAAISGAIHLSNYYRDTAAEKGLVGAPERALKHASLPLGLATITTAIGLLSLCTSDLVPIRLFGLYSAIGVVASLLLLCLFLPACLQLWPVRMKNLLNLDAEGEQVPESSPFWNRVGSWIIDHHAAVTLAGIISLVVMGYQTMNIQTSTQLMRMFPKGAKILADYTWLESNLGKLVPMEVVVKFDQDTNTTSFVDRMRLIDAMGRKLADIPQIGSVMSAATFAPKLYKSAREAEEFDPRTVLVSTGKEGKKFGLLDVARKVTDKKINEHRDQFLENGFITEEEVIQADNAPHTQELWRISTRVGALEDINFGEFQQELRTLVDDMLGGDQIKNEHGVEIVYTGLIPLVDKSQRSLLDGLLIGFIMDLVVVTLVMMVVIREWSAGIVLLLPSVFPVVVVFGYMAIAGVIVDTGTVMAPGVALGVTIDDVVHFMIMYRKGLEQGLDRRQSIMLAYRGCARPMYQSWGVIGLGLSAFVFSPFTPTQRFGYLMVTLLTAALVGNLVLLPAVLAGPFGALFGRRFQRRSSEGSRSDESSAEWSGSLPHRRPVHEESLAK